jgi:hypothetical protein
MLVAGQRIGSPPFLLVLFALWVLSPFVLLALALWRSQNWLPSARKMLDSVILVITAATVAIYAAVAFGAAKPRPPVFVVVPPVSWLVRNAGLRISARV